MRTTELEWVMSGSVEVPSPARPDLSAADRLQALDAVGVAGEQIAVTDGEVSVGQSLSAVVVPADDGGGEEGAQAVAHVPGVHDGCAPVGGGLVGGEQDPVVHGHGGVEVRRLTGVAVQGRHGQPVGVEGRIPQQQGLGALRVGVVEAAHGDGVVGEVVGVEVQQIRVKIGAPVRRHLPQRGGDRGGVVCQEHRVDVVVEDLDGLRFRAHPRDAVGCGSDVFHGGDHAVQDVTSAPGREEVPGCELPGGQVQQHGVRAVRQVDGRVLVAQDVDETVHAVVLAPAVHDRARECGLTCRDTHGGKVPPMSGGRLGGLAW